MMVAMAITVTVHLIHVSKSTLSNLVHCHLNPAAAR
jgi:hypothetical protein